DRPGPNGMGGHGFLPAREAKPPPIARQALISEPCAVRKRRSRSFGFGLGRGRLARGSFGRRQLNEKPGAAIEIVRLGGGKRNCPAVALDEIGGDRQAEPGAGVARRLVERLEDALAEVGRESRSG